jgi:hypothetical protein
MAQLAEQHRYELGPAPEPPSVPLGLMFPHGGFTLQTREQLQHLRE